MAQQIIGEITENEMELIHNALYVYLKYLQVLNEGDSHSLHLSNVVIDTYVDAKALRSKLVTLAGGDLTEANATEVTDTLGEMF